MSIQKTKSPQVLIISPEPWNGHFVSKHHYAITLASLGYLVYFLSPPDNAVSDITIAPTRYENLWSVRSPQVAKGLRFYPKMLRNMLERRWLERLEQKMGARFTTVWLFENSRFYDMGFAGNRLKIYHSVDLNQNFHVKEASQSADICFCTTDHILNEVVPYNNKVFKIHHGVNLLPKTVSLSDEKYKCFSSQKINATYIGNLAMQYLDVELLANMVRAFPHVQFQFVGGYDEKTPLYQSCHDAKNVTWWGKVDSELIPPILEASDVVMVCYQKRYYVDQSSPHKMMEYLASGKVIVATYTDEYKDKQNLLEMAYGSEAYRDVFEKVLGNLPFYNSPEKQEERIRFAKEHSYEKQLEKIIKHLKEYNFAL